MPLWNGGSFPPISHGGNVQGPDDSCFLTDPTDQSNVADLGFGPLEPSENGYTLSLLPGSPPPQCPEIDQRGAMQPQDGDGDGVAVCDAGAFELGTPNGLAVVPVLSSAGLIAFAVVLAAALAGKHDLTGTYNEKADREILEVRRWVRPLRRPPLEKPHSSRKN